MKYILTFLLSITIFCGTYAQYDTIYLAVMPFNASGPKGETIAKKAQSNSTIVIDEDYRILRVDRDENASNAVIWEREFQKSEDFIDGKIVEQGKAIGADYVMQGFYDVKIKELSISIYSMADGSLKGSIIVEKSGKKKKRKSGALDLATMKIVYDKPAPLNDADMKASVKKLINKCFPDKAWAVLRPTSENKSKVKKLLIAAGSRMGLKRKRLMEVLVIHVEDVDGVKIERMESIAWGKIEEVESENFSTLKIEAGEKNIKQELAKGKKLRCRVIKK